MDSKTLAIIAALVLATTSFIAPSNNLKNQGFENFKTQHGKVYASVEEESYRLAIWAMNMKEINEHNAKGTETYTKGENHFTDLTKEEFKSIYLGFKPRESISQPAVQPVQLAGSECDYCVSQGYPCINSAQTYCYLENNDGTCPAGTTKCGSSGGSVNWVTKGDVQRVKNQGQCGSCWAFSTVSACESADAIYKGTLGDFSEQQLVDCATSYGNNGCKGGLMDNGFKYFIANGICTESSYPYRAVDGTCQSSSCTKSSFTISSYTDVSSGSTSGLKAACNKQPVSIAVDASAWSSYSGGIFSSCGTNLDHGVILAGYSDSYWLVRNSWGSSWGESGYIRLAPGNTCGLANTASYPNV